MRLKPIIKRIYNVNEANLTGNSRSGKTSNWEYYVARNFDKNVKYAIESDGDVLDSGLNVIGNVKKGDTIEILSPDLLTKGNSSYAKSKVVSSGLEGYIQLKHIQKPTTTSKKEKEGATNIVSAIPGGTTSKEFTPDKLGLTDIKFSSADAMISTVYQKIQSVYGGDKFYAVRKYIYACMNSMLGTSITESFTKTYALTNVEPISETDINILSKNFGEVLGAIYILKTNKKAKYVEFPTDISQGLYDFLMVENTGITNYFSSKSKGGSSTSIGNVNFVLNNFSDTNVMLKNNKHEVDVIRSLMNNKKEGITTILNIQNFFENHLASKKNEILKKINQISTYKINSLSQEDLTKWFDGMLKKTDKDTFISTMNEIYNTTLGDMGKAKKADIETLKQIYEFGDGSKFGHGYLLYPMGSYIASYLNNTGNYRNVLNVILNFATFVHTVYMDMSIDSVKISISSFKSQSFRFSYNAATKYPGNRPIGFIKA